MLKYNLSILCKYYAYCFDIVAKIFENVALKFTLLAATKELNIVQSLKLIKIEDFSTRQAPHQVNA